MRKKLFMVFICLSLLAIYGCKSLYFQYMVTVAPGRFHLKENHEQLSIPVYSSHPLGKKNHDVEYLIVMIHGGALNAGNAFRNGAKLSKHLEISQDKVMIVAPQFLETGAGEDERRLLFWDKKWREGEDSLFVGENKGLPGVSSYVVLDKLLDCIVDNSPNLRRITVLGHSAGGQFVTRYAGITKLHEPLERRGVQVRYVVANPSSYLYLDETRYKIKSDGDVAEFSCDELLDCPRYNDYKYGLKNRYGYAKDLPEQTIRRQLLTRPIMFVLGKSDTERDWGLDRSCQGDAQGENRYQRGLLYKHHLNHFLEKSALPSRQVWLEIPDVGHDSTGIFLHPLFIKGMKEFD